jgi:hemerythrin-like metal-binding protein
MVNSRNQLVWKDEYSVGVGEIDEQHKGLFNTINYLIQVNQTGASAGDIEKIIAKIVDYKTKHFATEEKYFKLFNYDGAEEHIKAHRLFEESVAKLSGQYKDDPMSFAVALVDFLEDWLISHLMTMDRKYITCFKNHGLS